MTVQAWLIFTPEQDADAQLLNGDGVALIPRAIDNPMANSLGEGTLVGKSVAGARLLNDPDYTRWVEMCSVLPIRTMDSDTLFIPPPDI